MSPSAGCRLAQSVPLQWTRKIAEVFKQWQPLAVAIAVEQYGSAMKHVAQRFGFCLAQTTVPSVWNLPRNAHPSLPSDIALQQ
jgi:hypothetical protein